MFLNTRDHEQSLTKVGGCVMGMENIWVKIVKMDNNMGNKISINIKNTIKNTAGKRR